MTVIQILDNDFDTIQQFIKLGREKFNLTININNTNTNLKNNETSLPDYLDKRLKNVKHTNKERAQKLKEAFEAIDKTIDNKKRHLSLNDAKNLYFNDKTN